MTCGDCGVEQGTLHGLALRWIAESGNERARDNAL
jgi:hypothetical protein